MIQIRHPECESLFFGLFQIITLLVLPHVCRFQKRPGQKTLNSASQDLGGGLRHAGAYSSAKRLHHGTAEGVEAFADLNKEILVTPTPNIEPHNRHAIVTWY